MFSHLHLHTPYSFLDGGSDIEDLVRQAAAFGMGALAMTDHNSTAASVKFVTLCRGYGIRPILGAEMTMEDETHLTLLARDRAGYATLCTLLTCSYARGGRLSPHLPWEALDFEPESDPGLICLSGCMKGLVPALVRARKIEEAEAAAIRLARTFGPENFYLELQDDLTPHCDRANRELADLARRIGVGVVATNNVHYARREDYIAHDVLRCIAAKTTISRPHPLRPLNAERYLKSQSEMEALFAWCPEAIENTQRIADRCEPALPEDEEITPYYSVPGIDAQPNDRPYQDAATYLRHLTYKGGRARYRTLTPRVEARIEHELDVICRLGYADYFLMVWDIVRWARKQGIRCTGRGSAADSCVAYCLYLTDVDVIARNLPFARFLVPGKTPDIDMDFPNERRDDVFRYIIEKYGEEHVGMICTFHTFWARSAVRDIGKALELPEEALKFFSKNIHHHVRASAIDAAFDRYAELRSHTGIRERFHLLFDLCARIAGFPRHIGTHSSGIVISRVPLSNLAPLQPSARGLTQIWTLDKDDAEMVGAIKFDVLSLRILSAVGDAERDIRKSEEEDLERKVPRFRYERIPMDDTATYRMFRAGGAVGAFQFESAAQMALAVILEPEHFEDLVAAVALIRPGPIRGNVVSRFVACRNGWARADVLHPCLSETLAKTYGCIVFQEQVNDVVAAMTGCSDAEGDKFRKSLTRRDKLGKMDEARDEFVHKACTHHPDLSTDRANTIFDQIEGWSGYGFTEGHAASFALTGYRSAYISHHHPAPFFAGLMNHQPMGFFSSNTLAGEARRRGVQVLPVEINRSGDKCCAENERTIRLGLRIVAQMREEDIDAIVAAREEGAFRSLLDFCIRIPMHRDRLENLILCGAFDALHEHRRGLLWKLDETIGLAGTWRAWETAFGEVESRKSKVESVTSTAPHPRPLSLSRRGENGNGTSPPGGERSTPTPQWERCHPERSEGSAVDGEPSAPKGVSGAIAGGFSHRQVDPLPPTPVDREIDDFSVWDKFLWTWRITGVCGECHVFAYLRDMLSRYRVMSVYEAQRQKSGTRVTVAGLNVRPHRPPTRSGEPVLFTLVEDETGLMQTTVAGPAIQGSTGVFVTAPAVLVRGIVQKRGQGVTLNVEKAKPLDMGDFVRPITDEANHDEEAAAPDIRVRVCHATEVVRR